MVIVALVAFGLGVSNEIRNRRIRDYARMREATCLEAAERDRTSLEACRRNAEMGVPYSSSPYIFCDGCRGWPDVAQQLKERIAALLKDAGRYGRRREQYQGRLLFP